MKCLSEDCNNEFENKTGRKKFCSNACKMKYFRRHGKKDEIKPFQMKALYNEMMNLFFLHKSEFPKEFKDVKQVGILKEDGNVEPIFNTEQSYIQKAENAKNRKELENILIKMKKDKDITFFGKQRIEAATKHLFDNFFND